MGRTLFDAGSHQLIEFRAEKKFATICRA